jgi:MOSC domain-containing protein YiiM
MTSTRTARLLSVNVGLPRDVPWRGNTVHTAVWKTPVQGRRMVRRLNIDGDRQGDLDGHGGEHRAVCILVQRKGTASLGMKTARNLAKSVHPERSLWPPSSAFSQTRPQPLRKIAMR